MLNVGSYHLGRRGAFLALFGGAFILIGQALMQTDETQVVRHVFRFALALAPLWVYGVAWIVCGVIALVDGLLQRGSDAIGFAFASLMPTIWTIVYLAAWIGDDLGFKNLWQSAVLYALIAGAISCVAGMPETPAHLKVKR